MKKHLLFAMLLLSVSLNCFYIGKTIVPEPLVDVDGETVVTRSEIENYYNENYKTIVRVC